MAAYAETYAKERSMLAERHVRLFKNGKNQALRIPREFELPGNEAIIRKEGDRLIVEPARKTTLLELLATWEPSDDPFPNVDDGLLPPDDVEL
jgi:antitoxin VapB